MTYFYSCDRKKEEEDLPVTSVFMVFSFFLATTDKVPETINCLKIGSEADEGILSLNYLFLNFSWLADI